MLSICWPAIIKQQTSEELIYLANQTDWLEYCCLQLHLISSNDRLLDSEGSTFDIVIEAQAHPQQHQANHPTAELPQLRASQHPIDLVTFIQYVRTHATLNDHCCSAKLVFTDIKQGIDTVAYLESI
ncbi:DUF4144 family protein [Shewanella japonica]|uniref:Uncharacterized protein n=1 Tax=Shewanella japonica TaxID=93973 RepID=A0ABM6JG22_9GAMM|nr:DUF4144 family protein [Shewanella japonica]ARD21046.1 hypothetical protein SJ2017_0709 [Shewanella japonica]